MFEVTGLFLIILAVAATTFLPSLGYSILFDTARKEQLSIANRKTAEEKKIPEDSVLRRHFLANLQAEIESALAPRPTDAVLQRHYDTLVAAEMAKHLAKLTA